MGSGRNRNFFATFCSRNKNRDRRAENESAGSGRFRLLFPLPYPLPLPLPLPLPNSLTCLYKKANERSCISKAPTTKKPHIFIVKCKFSLIEKLFTFNKINIKEKLLWSEHNVQLHDCITNVYFRNGKNINILFVNMTFLAIVQILAVT